MRWWACLGLNQGPHAYRGYQRGLAGIHNPPLSLIWQGILFVVGKRH